MGLIVDLSKLELGGTNDGNTSQRFCTVVYKLNIWHVTGYDFNLMYHLIAALESISSGHKIHSPDNIFEICHGNYLAVHIVMSMVSNNTNSIQECCYLVPLT